MDDDDLMGGLNDLVNMADSPQLARKPKKPETVKPDSSKAENPLSEQILARLDDIKAGMDALCPAATNLPQGSSGKSENVKPTAQAQKRPVKPTPLFSPETRIETSELWPYIILVSAALELVAFAVGMGYGAIVTTHRFPVWSHAGLAGALTDWIAAPAGILLFPSLSGLFFWAGHVLRKEDDGKSATVFYGLSGLCLAVAVILPFMASV